MQFSQKNTIEEFNHYLKFDAIRDSGPPLDALMKFSRCINREGMRPMPVN
jgi:hypothetical protein